MLSLGEVGGPLSGPQASACGFPLIGLLLHPLGLADGRVVPGVATFGVATGFPSDTCKFLAGA